MRRRQVCVNDTGLFEMTTASSDAEAKIVEVPSRRYGKYLIRSRIGVGGMAEVFLAETVDELGCEVNVALKLMRHGIPQEIFDNEADLMGILSHPNLVKRLEIGEAFGRPFIAMEFLVGGDLQVLMATLQQEGKQFPLTMAMYVILEAAKALAYFHQAKTRTGTPLSLTHGDVTPSNIFFSGTGEVKLGDFGVAKSREVNLGPQDGVAAGKLKYLSPEQSRGEPINAQSDLFSLGIILHELVLGFHPFDVKGGSEKAIINAIRNARLALPESLDRRLGAILKRALHPEPESRYPTAGAFAGELVRYALDNNVLPAQSEMLSWLEESLGLMI